MRRSYTALLALFAILWQAAQIGHAAGFVGAPGEADHTALHWAGQGHHHHDDGSYHADDSFESAQHLLADFVSGCPALPTAFAHPDASIIANSLHDVDASDEPQACPEVPLEPPRSRS
jgi:hypothetical protein